MEQTWESGSAKMNFPAIVYLETASEVCHAIFVYFGVILNLDGASANYFLALVE
jgi:hypothetical protein